MLSRVRFRMETRRDGFLRTKLSISTSRFRISAFSSAITGETGSESGVDKVSRSSLRVLRRRLRGRGGGTGSSSDTASSDAKNKREETT